MPYDEDQLVRDLQGIMICTAARIQDRDEVIGILVSRHLYSSAEAITRMDPSEYAGIVTAAKAWKGLE